MSPEEHLKAAMASPASLTIAAGETCPATGREYCRGHGALSKADQTSEFIRERDRLADLPTAGERCAITGRRFEIGSGCLTKSEQTAAFAGARK